MTQKTGRIERRIRWASFLVCAGLLIQSITLVTLHPLAFVAFLAVGCPIAAAGIALYLWSLVSPDEAATLSCASPKVNVHLRT